MKVCGVLGWGVLAGALCVGGAWAQEVDEGPEDVEVVEGDEAEVVEEGGGGTSDATLPVEVELELGFGGKVVPRGFSGVSVRLRAREAVTGPVTVVVWARDTESELLRLGPVELGEGWRRVRGLAPSQSLLDHDALVAWAVDEGGVVLGSVEAVAERFTQRLVLVLDERGAFPADLSALSSADGEVEPGQRKASRREWSAAALSEIADLPGEALGYSSANAVLLGDMDFAAWEPAQARALADYVLRGGNLVVVGGDRASALRRSPLGEALGEALEVLPDVPPERDVDVSWLGDALEVAVGSEMRAASVAQVRWVEGAEELVEAPEGVTPLVVSAPAGLGSVRVIAPDLWQPPLLLTPLAAELMGVALKGAWRAGHRSQQLFEELVQVRQPASVGPAFAMLILYAMLAGPIAYFTLRPRKRGIWLWVVIPGITAVFTALVPLYRLVLKEAESSMVGVKLVEAQSGVERARFTTDVLLFSGSLEDKTLSYRGESMSAFGIVPRSLRSRRGRRGTPELGPVLGLGAEGVELRLPVALWGARYVAFEGMVKAPEISGSVSLSLRGTGPEAPGRPPSARIQLNYAHTHPMDEARVLYYTPGGPMVHTFSERLTSGTEVDARALPTPAGTSDAEGGDLAQVLMTRMEYAVYLSQVKATPRAILIGHCNELPPLQAGPNVRAGSFPTIYAVELPLEFVDGVPFEQVRASVEAETVESLGGGSVRREVRTTLRLPEPPPSAPVRLLLQVEGSNRLALERLDLELLDPATGEWEPVRPAEPDEPGPPQRQVLIDVPEPARWVSARGEIQVRQRFVRGSSESDDAVVLTLGASVHW